MTKPVFIIAEVGSVHDGSLGNAKKLIEMAAEKGVDAVKFQTHIAQAETLKDAPQPPYFKGEPRFEYFERTGFSKDQWKELRECCTENNVEFLSSPFSVEAVDLLEEVGIDQYKIPSGEITNIPLISYVAKTKKPVLLSSGMSNWDELDSAVAAIKEVHDNIILLQCTSEYPCPYENVGLNVLNEMKERYNLPVGLSDHTLNNYSSFAAVTMGIDVLEKHITFSRYMYGSDAKTSLEPEEIQDLVDGCRAIETMKSHTVDKSDASKFADMKNIFQKSVVSVVDIASGTTITAHMVAVKKPGTGIPASKLQDVIGTVAAKDISADRLLEEADLGW